MILLLSRLGLGWDTLCFSILHRKFQEKQTEGSREEGGGENQRLPHFFSAECVLPSVPISEENSSALGGGIVKVRR